MVGEGVHDIYKERAAKGGDVLWHCTIKGQKELAPGIPLHMSLKVFEHNKDMNLKEIKAKVKEFDIKTPVPSKLKFKTTIFTSERDGKKYYMLLVENHDENYSKFYESLKHCGTVYKKYMAHVTIDKDLYEKINKEGLKPEEIKFDDLTIEAGAGNTIHEFEKSEKDESTSLRKNMNINEKEIHSVEDAGSLDNAPVKMVRTKGGFWIAVGKPKGKFREEALAAGSHPAIVRYNVEKNFPSFQPIMMKSEGLEEPIVKKHSHFLSPDLIKSGHDIYSVQTGDTVEFQITRHNMKIASVPGLMEKDYLIISNLNIPPQFSRGMAGASVEKATDSKIGLRFKK